MKLSHAPSEGSKGPAASPANGVLGAIGRTPLVRLERLLGDGAPKPFLKLEAANPGGSAKDRPAAGMLLEALEQGRVRPGGTVVESSSGNMGIGLAQACAYLGLHFVCVVDLRTSPEKIATMKAYGAEVRMVSEPDPALGDLLATRIATVARICAADPNAFWPDQYENRANPASHARGTMREIYEEMDGRVDALFVATSTTGTLAGCESFLREEVGAGTEIVAVDAEGSALFGGSGAPRPLPGFGAGIETGISRSADPDRVIRIGAADSVAGCRRLIRREAIFAGASTGAVVAAMARLAPELGTGARVAAIAPDGGASYLGTVYDDEWVERELGLEPERLERMVAADPAPASAPA